ncbi:hypothetical protein BV898_12996 [Hypsibius exemplaris]|uniref:Uncharacterized protein n=1 Tax=Hypsibius exemplaris TaxID=2072580 RepID=A0A1W0WC67_HYPEX|nr:hypothetical protein BV898_12996 [Hypsibius exemplaris]
MRDLQRLGGSDIALDHGSLCACETGRIARPRVDLRLITSSYQLWTELEVRKNPFPTSPDMAVMREGPEVVPSSGDISGHGCDAGGGRGGAL